MNIRPTKLSYANTLPSKIVVFNCEEKIPVLIFKSITVCVQYLFSHKVLTDVDRRTFGQLITNCNDKKRTETKNIFGIKLTYRIASEKYQQLLADNDFVILDNRFKIDKFKTKQTARETFGTGYNQYELEEILEVGDTVVMKYGSHKGKKFEIIEVKEKPQRMTSGSKYYVLNVDSIKHEYKANVLAFVKKKPLFGM